MFLGVTVRGHSLRPVEISPTSGTQSNDAFVVQGDSAVEDVTIKDFYYNSGSDTGYGFRMANNFRVYSHLPYKKCNSNYKRYNNFKIQIPRGYDAGDAGRGALLDGSIAHVDPKRSPILFHAVTFITPGATGLKITNGARCEWLNCFTYFAEKGIHMVDGTAGLKGDGKTRIKYSGLTGSLRSRTNHIFLMLAWNTISNRYY